MGEDAHISKIASTFILVAMMLFSVIIAGLISDYVITSYVTTATTEFVDEARITGNITQENFEQFTKKLSAVGVFEIKMCHGSQVTRIDRSGHVYVEYYEVYNEAIFKIMYPDNGQGDTYEMNPGDMFTITVTRSEHSFAGKLLQAITPVRLSNGPIVHYGGEVGGNR